MYTLSHKAIKGPRPGSAIPKLNKQQDHTLTAWRPADASSTVDNDKQGFVDVEPSLAELLLGEIAEATQSTRGPTPSAEENPTVSPEAFITSYRHIVAGNEAREKKLVKNMERWTAIRSELEELEEEADMLKTAPRQSKAEHKRLRTSLSASDLAFLQLGQDLAHEGSKRMRFEDSGEEQCDDKKHDVR